MGLLSSLFGNQQPVQQPPTALSPNTPTVQQIDTAANPGHGLLFGNYRDPAQEMAQLALFSQLASGQTVQDQMNFAPTLIPMQQAMAAKQQAADTKNKTVAMLQQKAPELASAVASGALSPSDALAQMFKQEQEAKTAAKPQFQTFSDGSYGWVNPSTKEITIVGRAAGKNNLINTGKGLLYDPDTKQWIQPPADMAQSSTDYNKTPIYATDANGNPILLQTGENGTAVQTKLPEGVKLGKDPIKIDAGTKWVLIDPTTRQPIGEIQKDIAGEEAAKVKGQMTQQNLQALPQTLAQADDAVKSIDKALNNSTGLENSAGWESMFPTFPGSKSADFQASLDTIKGATFLQAYQRLKGTGAISEAEGQKAENAIASLSLSQSDQQLKQSLMDLRQVIVNGQARAKAMAGVQTPGAGADSEINSLVDKYRTK